MDVPVVSGEALGAAGAEVGVPEELPEETVPDEVPEYIRAPEEILEGA